MGRICLNIGVMSKGKISRHTEEPKFAEQYSVIHKNKLRHNSKDKQNEHKTKTFFLVTIILKGFLNGAPKPHIGGLSQELPDQKFVT